MGSLGGTSRIRSRLPFQARSIAADWMVSHGATSSPNCERAWRPSPCSPSGWETLRIRVQVKTYRPEWNSQNTSSTMSTTRSATPSSRLNAAAINPVAMAA